jgi:putative spermidine/putrescine transport system substrate-binding protein
MSSNKITRRHFIKHSAIAGAAAATSGFWVSRRAKAEEPLKVALYGGIFEHVLGKVLIKPFQKDTGIPTVGKPEPTGEVMFVQLSNAVKAGQAPVDVAMIKVPETIKGIRTDLWLPYDESAMPNLNNVEKAFFQRHEGKLYAVSALAWYINIVYNTRFIKSHPDSWEAFWNDKYQGDLALLSLPDNSYLLDITAKCYFGGNDILKTKKGVLKVLKKLAEVKSNVSMWYKDEATFESALKSGNVPMGQLYNDVTQVMIDKGAPVKSVFPKEGPVVDRGNWQIIKTTKKAKQAMEFINYACKPEVQQAISKNLYTIPSVHQDLVKLPGDLGKRVLGPGPEHAIIPDYSLYLEESDWLQDQWNKTLVG